MVPESKNGGAGERAVVYPRGQQEALSLIQYCAIPLACMHGAELVSRQIHRRLVFVWTAYESKAQIPCTAAGTWLVGRSALHLFGETMKIVWSICTGKMNGTG